MTTYSFNARYVNYGPDEKASEYRDATISLIVGDGATSVTYGYDTAPVGFGPTPVELLADNFINLLLDWAVVDPDDLVSWVMEVKTDTTTSYVWGVDIRLDGVGEYYILLGGDDLFAGLDTKADFDTLETLVTSVGDAPAGSGFEPGTQILTYPLPDGVSRYEDDAIFGTPGNDSANAGIGNDVFFRSEGQDTLDGGDGEDGASYQGLDTFIRANLSGMTQQGILANTVVTANYTDQVFGVENFYGTAHDDIIIMGDSTGYVFDRAGNDSVTGGAGGTAFMAGSGDDTYVGVASNDLLSYRDDGWDSAGDPVFGIVVSMTGQGTGTVADGWGWTDSFSGIELIEGGYGDDLFYGGSGNDEFAGGGGDDHLRGFGGDDRFFMDTGDDTFDGGDGFDLLLIDLSDEDPNAYDLEINLAGQFIGKLGETDHRDEVISVESIELTGGLDAVFTGTDADEKLYGDTGSDTLNGGGGNDTLKGGDSADTLIGGAGNDVLFGGDTANDLRDQVYGGDGNDSIDGGYGNDELRGDAGDDSIEGGFGVDTVIGGTGNDVLTGSAWSDLIFGGDGDDFINGGFGFDRVNGGTGADKFYHTNAAGHGSDWIQDFDAAQGDVLFFGGGAATKSDFLVQRATTANAGDASVQEVFVTHVPSGNLLWALVDGDAQTSLNVLAAGQTFDLLA
ncbi:calcium-binding protein [Pseudoprimorskyibacter insulae]|uniref:Leukotoxin n=1 Tax=Pseudoprimorskyibacter insulae TaxID=1695997 RepID=A0A2R8AQK9_9RHOB|nr:calcium-binding protein [Pseudoprimorskyibacter insulae]SPF78361.1 Leukotoxin [Pseudoprimorskyibacter insulae]